MNRSVVGTGGEGNVAVEHPAEINGGQKEECQHGQQQGQFSGGDPPAEAASIRAQPSGSLHGGWFLSGPASGPRPRRLMVSHVGEDSAGFSPMSDHRECPTVTTGALPSQALVEE